MSVSAYAWLVGPMASNPQVYQLDGQLYDWNTGELVAWQNERVLVRMESGRDYWTWVDVSGARQWQISAKV